jgi:hypothetical protein
MDCAEIRNAFVRGTSLDDAAAREHVAVCNACRELSSAGNRLGRALAEGARSTSGALAPPASWNLELATSLERKFEEDRGNLGRLKALPTRWRLTLAAGLILLLAAASLRRESAGAAALLPAGLMFVLVLALVLNACLAPLSRPEHPKGRLALVLVAAALPFAMAYGLRSLEAGKGSWGGVSAALACFTYGWAFSVPIGLLLFTLDRRKRMPLAGTLLVAAACGLGASLILEVHCAIRHPAHLMLGHASIGLLWMLGCAVYTQVLSRLRRYAQRSKAS